MTINTIEFTANGEYRVNRNVNAADDREYIVPPDIPRGMLKVQAWIDAGNTPTPYSAPVQTWEENRQAEYPTIAELVVALYDTDDKAALEKRRSDVKAKYPKPE